MLLTVSAIIPAWIALWIVYRVDRHPEYKYRVFILYLLGAVCVAPAGWIEKYLLDLYAHTPDPQTGFIAILVTAFFVAGMTEETLKGIVFYRAVLNRQFFDEPFDGIIFAVAIGLGFATIENILYVQSDGLSSAFVRAFTAIPAHALFGIIMGSYFSEHRFDRKPLWPAFVVPAILHGMYDTFALAQGYLANLLLVLYLMWLVRLAFIKTQKLMNTTRREMGVPT